MYRRSGKRALDVLLSGLAILVTLPLMAVVAAAIRLEDGGGALFRQERVGRCGKVFTLLKFRSMPPNTQNIPSAHTATTKITLVGRFIRRTNIDELAQLVNVLRGEMSLVGPRPALASQTALCEMREKSGAMRCAPGLTGLAQVNSYDGMTDAEKAGWDAQYAATVSCLGDLRIIGSTFRYLLKPPPVY